MMGCAFFDGGSEETEQVFCGLAGSESSNVSICVFMVTECIVGTFSFYGKATLVFRDGMCYNKFCVARCAYLNHSHAGHGNY